jgi:hypothetical protein
MDEKCAARRLQGGLVPWCWQWVSNTVQVAVSDHMLPYDVEAGFNYPISKKNMLPYWANGVGSGLAATTSEGSGERTRQRGT